MIKISKEAMDECMRFFNEEVKYAASEFGLTIEQAEKELTDCMIYGESEHLIMPATPFYFHRKV